MNLDTFIPREFIEVHKRSELDGYLSKIYHELSDIAATQTAAHLEIPFPIPRFAIIENGEIYGKGLFIRPQIWQKLQYSLYSLNNRQVQESVNLTWNKMIKILSWAPRLWLDWWGVWVDQETFTKFKADK